MELIHLNELLLSQEIPCIYELNENESLATSVLQNRTEIFIKCPTHMIICQAGIYIKQNCINTAL